MKEIDEMLSIKIVCSQANNKQNENISLNFRKGSKEDTLYHQHFNE